MHRILIIDGYFIYPQVVLISDMTVPILHGLVHDEMISPSAAKSKLEAFSKQHLCLYKLYSGLEIKHFPLTLKTNLQVQAAIFTRTFG